MNKNEIIEKLFSENTDEVISSLITLNEENIFDEDIVKEVLKLFKLTDNDMIRELIVEYFKKTDYDWLNKELVRLFASTNAFLRNAAMDILRNKRGNVINTLIESMESDDKDIRKLTVDTAYMIDDPRKVEVLKKGLKDEDINVVITTVEYIGELGLKEFKDCVFELYQKAKDPFLKVVSLETLSVIGDKEILEKLKPDFQNIENVEKVLLFPFFRIVGNFGSEDDIDFLAKSMDTLDTTYLKEITNAIEHIVQNNNIEELKEDVYLKIESMLFKDINSINKYGIITFLGNFKNKELNNTLKICLRMDDRMLIIGCLEVIGLKGKEQEFKEELRTVREKFKEDEEIIGLLEDLM